MMAEDRRPDCEALGDTECEDSCENQYWCEWQKDDSLCLPKSVDQRRDVEVEACGHMFVKKYCAKTKSKSYWEGKKADFSGLMENTNTIGFGTNMVWLALRHVPRPLEEAADFRGKVVSYIRHKMKTTQGFFADDVTRERIKMVDSQNHGMRPSAMPF